MIFYFLYLRFGSDAVYALSQAWHRYKLFFLWSYKVTMSVCNSVGNSVCHTVHDSVCHPVLHGVFSLKWLRIFPIFCVIIDDSRTHRYSQMAFLKRFLIWDYRGVSRQKGVYWLFWPSLQYGSYDLPNFSHDSKGQWCTLLEPNGFSEKILNPGL